MLWGDGSSCHPIPRTPHGIGVAAQPGGGFVVAWSSSLPHEASGQRFDSTANRIGTEFSVGGTDIFGLEPLILSTTDESGAFVVSAAGGAHAFDETGMMLGAPFSLAEIVRPVEGSHVLEFAFTEPSRFVAVGQFIGSSSTNVMGRRFELLASTTTTTTLPVPIGQCGDPISSPQPLLALPSTSKSARARVVTATDALFVLQAAVGSQMCAPCVCDVNNSAGTTSTDALIVLQASVGQPVSFTCPPCI